MVLPGAAHQGAGGVVQDGADIDLDVAAPGDGVLQQLDNILVDDTGTVEALRPGLQQALGEAQLAQREREGEAQWQALLIDIVLRHKVGEALGYVIEQLGAGADHNVLGDGIDAGLHLEVVVLLQVDQQHPEVGAAEVEGEELAALIAVGQVLHVRNKALDIGLWMGVLGEAASQLVEDAVAELLHLFVR